MEFNPSEFASSSNEERIAKCRMFAKEAIGLAQTANGTSRTGYLELARRWEALACEMEELERSNSAGAEARNQA